MARGRKRGLHQRNLAIIAEPRRHAEPVGSTDAKPPDEPARAASFYADLLTPRERIDLARLYTAEVSLADEIALLRVAIRRGMVDGENLETIGRSVQRLAQTLKAARSLRGESLREIEDVLTRVLDEIGQEI
jgi:hypothetical protein